MRPEQKLAICAGSVPLSAEDRVEMLAILAVDADPGISGRAENALLTQSAPHFLAAASRPDADLRLFSYCAENLAEKPGIADALAKNAAARPRSSRGSRRGLRPKAFRPCSIIWSALSPILIS